MAELTKLNLSGSYLIPVEQFNPLKVSVSASFEKEKDISDEEFFAKCYKQFDEIKEAHIALEIEKRNNIENKYDMLDYAYSLLDDLKEGAERFRQAFYNLIGKTKED